MTENEAKYKVAKENKEELGLVQRGVSMFLDVAKFEFGKKVAAMLATSSMLPEQFRGKDGVANCMILLNLADRMNVDPFMLAQNIYIVHGKPGLEAKLAIALHNGSGRFEPMEFEFQSEEGKEDWGCRAFAKEIKSEKVLFGTWVTWKMVKAEGWLDKTGSKWKSMPDQMFMYRAAMFFIRTNSPETLLGLRTKDELDDMIINVTSKETFAQAEEKATAQIEEGANKDVIDIPSQPEMDKKIESVETVEELKASGEMTSIDPDFTGKDIADF